MENSGDNNGNETPPRFYGTEEFSSHCHGHHLDYNPWTSLSVSAFV